MPVIPYTTAEAVVWRLWKQLMQQSLLNGKKATSSLLPPTFHIQYAEKSKFLICSPDVNFRNMYAHLYVIAHENLREKLFFPKYLDSADI